MGIYRSVYDVIREEVLKSADHGALVAEAA
jgi:hypothetical protein